MAEPLKIFLGSSNEARTHAEELQRLIDEIGGESVQVRSWWDGNVFPPGGTFIHSLANVMRETDAALLVTAAEDKTVSRGKEKLSVRDNVILELGMSIATHTLERTALAVLNFDKLPSTVPGSPTETGNSPAEVQPALDVHLLNELKLPSDLSGVNHIVLKRGRDDQDFRNKNRGEIKDLISHWNKSKREKENELKIVLPKLYETAIKVVTSFKSTAPPPNLDHISAALLDALNKHFSVEELKSGITRFVCNRSLEFLEECNAIWATDVLGPSAWLTPTAFRYLAIQIRAYFGANAVRPNEPFRMSPGIAGAIGRASENMRRLGRPQSVTKFDDQFFESANGRHRPFHWSEGHPELEFVRILLWTEDEMRDPVAASVMAIHEAFHVPLFALIVAADAPEREFDFIAFKQRDGGVKGFTNERTHKFVPDEFLTGGEKYMRYWDRLFTHDNLMFAADVRHLLLEHPGTLPLTML